ncbi:MAG TPA: hypothetical protein VH331_08545 [Allosphingosinicella sp.]|jgi:hypothetical protein|nr:hypothetical protein [Allosphingosinicella sp.]
MFMERIEVPADEARRSKLKSVKLAAGAIFLPVAALLWVPWLCVTALWFVVGGLAKVIAKTGTTIRDTLLYAGELVVGR